MIGDGFSDTIVARPVSKVESFVEWLRKDTEGEMTRMEAQVICYRLTKGDGDAA